MLCHWTTKEYDHDKNVFVLFAAICLVYWQLLQNNNVVKPFTPTSDQDRTSPYNIDTISSRQVMRIEKNINHGIIS